MRRNFVMAAGLVALLVAPSLVSGQQRRRPPQRRAPAEQAPAAEHTQAAPGGASNPDSSITYHTITIGGQRIDYEAKVGAIVLKDEQGEPEADVYYTEYTKRGVEDETERPITFAYNGGPGSSSVWVHMGAFGPRTVETPDTAHAPPPPYTLHDNPYSILDATDLVFIDPVGTGYSHPVGKATGKEFWGVDEDANSLAQFVSRFLSESGRWNSPRYLLGESYGTTRSAALVNLLQERYSMDFNGVVLMSMVLNFQTISFGPGNDMPYILYLPSYAAVAWYHHALQNRAASLEPFVKEVEDFASGPYAHALMLGDQLPASERQDVLQKLSQYTGLSTDYWDKADLRVNNSQFEKELMREKGIVIGRLDARFTGPTEDELGEYADYDPQSADISSAYASTFNMYMHDELKFGQDMQYQISGNVNPWDWKHGRGFGWPGYTNVAVDLANALRRNTRLQVLLNNGYFDLATPFYASVYTMDHLGLPPDLRAHIHIASYMAGHMMYVYGPSHKELHDNIDRFIGQTSGTARGAATTEGK
jgi:carboxypeptidase C (cathepsin A)